MWKKNLLNSGLIRILNDRLNLFAIQSILNGLRQQFHFGDQGIWLTLTDDCDIENNYKRCVA